jgi:xanthine dehydrogenase large subunit
MNTADRTPAFAQVGLSLPHESAHLHVAGARPTPTTCPKLAGTLHAALGLSPLAHGRLIEALDLAASRAARRGGRAHGAADIPGPNDCGALVHDDPSWPASGQHAALPGPAGVCRGGHTRDAARRAAAQAKCDPGEPLPPGADTAGRPRGAAVRGAADAPAARRRRGAWRPRRSAWRSSLTWAARSSSTWKARSAYAMPQEGRRHARALQHPAPQRDAACGGARAGRPAHGCRWSAGAWAAASAARNRSRRCLPAWRPGRGALQRPVKLRVDRDDDFLITGRRHCFHYALRGRLRRRRPHPGAEVEMVSRAGHSADLSGPVMTRALCHFDNAYWLPTWRCTATRPHQHPEQHRLPRLRRAAGRDGHRVHDRLASRASWAATRWTCAAPTSTAAASTTSRPTARWWTTTSSTR